MQSFSSLTPSDTGSVRVEQRITWRAGKDPVGQAMLSFLLTQVSALARSKVVTSNATHDASPDSRVCAIGRVQPFVLGEGGGKTQQPTSAEV